MKETTLSDIQNQIFVLGVIVIIGLVAIIYVLEEIRNKLK